MAAFVGRDGELTRLRALGEAALSNGTPCAALITGPPGTGKTRLLAEARRQTGLDRALSVVGYEPEQAVSFAAGLGLLRALAGVPDDGLRLASLLDPTAREPIEPFRLFEAAYRTLAGQGSCLIVADDLQWVDPSTIGLLHYLLRAAFTDGRPMALFAAARPSPQASAVAPSLERILGAEVFLRLELQPLDAEAGAALAASLQPNASPAEANALWERAEGSPFWIEVLASDPGPRTASSVAAARLEGLGRDAASVVAGLAVAGRPLAVLEITALLDWPGERAEAAVAEAVTAGAAVGAGPAVSVAHDLIREAALAQLPTDLVRTLHSRLATELERTAGSDAIRLHRALEHARAAGLESLGLALRLARSPRRRLLGAEGLRSLAAVADDYAASPDATALEVAVAELASELGEHGFALGRWTRIVDRSTGDAMLSAALRGAADAFQTRDARAAQALLERLAGVEDPVLAVERDTIDAGIRLWLTGDPDGGRAAASRAATQARRLVTEAGGLSRAPATLVHAYREALDAAFESAATRGADDEAWLLANEIRDASRGEVEQLDAELTIGGHMRRTGQWAQAEESFRRVWSRADAAALPEMRMDAGYRLATILLARGKLDESEEIATEADALGERIGGLAWTRSWFHADWYGTAHHRGGWRAGLDELERRASGEPDPHYRSGLRTQKIRWEARLAPDSSAVAAEVERCHADIREAGCLRCGVEFELTAGEALARAGLVDPAADEIEGWLERYPSASSTLRMRHTRTEGFIALARGNTATGLERLGRVVEAADQIGLAIESLWARLDLAAALTAVGERDAEDVWREAAAAADRIGAVTEMRIAEQGLRSLGVRTWRRGRTGTQGPTLSERERQIAELVSAGASNPEIASTLFLSRKTVERHISNILSKLGVRNRTELAGRFTAAGKD